MSQTSTLVTIRHKGNNGLLPLQRNYERLSAFINQNSNRPCHTQEDVIKRAESGEAHQLQKSSEQVAKIDIKDESTLT